MADIFNMADTWNAAGTTFTAIKMNVTDTASAAGSLLMDLQIGGVSKAKISKAGALTLAGGVVAEGHVTFTTDNTYDIGAVGATRPRALYLGGLISAGASITAGGASDIYLSGRAGISSPADSVLKVRGWNTAYSSLWMERFTVAQLPAAASYDGAIANVSDATATTARSIVAGGGANKVLVMSDGTNWLIVA